MSEQDKQAARDLLEAMATLSEEDKKYILGVGEGLRIAKVRMQKKGEENDDNQRHCPSHRLQPAADPVSGAAGGD